MALDYRMNKISRFYTFLDFPPKLIRVKYILVGVPAKKKSTQNILTLSSSKIVTLENLVAQDNSTLYHKQEKIILFQ